MALNLSVRQSCKRRETTSAVINRKAKPNCSTRLPQQTQGSRIKSRFGFERHGGGPSVREGAVVLHRPAPNANRPDPCNKVQLRINERADQPGPHRSLMIGHVARPQIAEMSAVSNA